MRFFAAAARSEARARETTSRKATIMLKALKARHHRALAIFYVILALFNPVSVHAIKFHLPAHRYPSSKCIWNPIHDNQLVIVTANVGAGSKQRVDVEIVDSSSKKNVYLSKRGINGETRLAVTSHAEGEVGVCFRNYLDNGTDFCPHIAVLLTNSPRKFIKMGVLMVPYRELLTWILT